MEWKSLIKAYLIISILLAFSSFLNAAVEICYQATAQNPNGTCLKISQIRINDNWIDACCDDFNDPAIVSCTDDC